MYSIICGRWSYYRSVSPDDDIYVWLLTTLVSICDITGHMRGPDVSLCSDTDTMRTVYFLLKHSRMFCSCSTHHHNIIVAGLLHPAKHSRLCRIMSNVNMKELFQDFHSSHFLRTSRIETWAVAELQCASVTLKLMKHFQTNWSAGQAPAGRTDGNTM